MAKLVIKNLHVTVEGKEILKGIDLTIDESDSLAILGPNGHGKSTLLNVIMGHPKYIVTEGSIEFDGVNLLEKSTDERARMGLFLGMQNPSEVPGVSTMDFLRSALNAKNEKPISTYNFYKLLNTAADELNIPFDMLTRSLNEGFSGGEKKRNEILQMLVLQPKISMLDEIDSGLDVDAIQAVSEIINKMKEKGMGFIVISHYARLLNLIQPTRAVVIINGKIVIDSDASVIKRIDKEGYEFIQTEMGISIKKEEPQMNSVSIGSCAVKESIK